MKQQLGCIIAHSGEIERPDWITLDNPLNVTYDLPVIGFGELRRLSTQWHADIAVVERAYCIDWVLKGIFDQPELARALVLCGSAALRYAHCPDYPVVEEPEFLAAPPVEQATLDAALTAAAQASGVRFTLIDFARTSAKVEYTGPLGRRSAAQPRIVLSFVPGQTRTEASHAPLIHPFSDVCAATVSAVGLEEFAAERIAQLAQAPRARDVFDLWFVLTHARERIDSSRTRGLARDIARAKNRALPRADPPFDPTRRAGLERAWDRALQRVPGHPPFAQIERDLIHELESIDLGG